jgi:hypothetical protein
MSRKHANTPPYVPRAGFRAVLDTVRSAKAGDILTRDQLHKRGISAHLIYPAIAALRYLGLIDDADSFTGRHIAFDRDEPDRPAQEALVRQAYADFFRGAMLPAPDVMVLKRTFQTVYDLSDRVVNSAFPLFQYLAQEAGIALTAQGVHAPILEEPRKSVHETRESGGEGIPLTQEDVAQTGEPGAHTLRVKHTGYQVVLNLQVTKYTTEKDIQKMIRTANRAIHLARKAGDTH